MIMASPFPGMDPYLEVDPFWSNFRSSLLTCIQGELKKRLPLHYSVWIDIRVGLDREARKFLTIKEARSERVITVLEFLSPANKTPGEDHDAFLKNRNEQLAAGRNIVE